MTDVILAITVLWGFIFIYAVMATMDFGAGFWSMLYIKSDKTNATNIANKYLSPTWEVTNVFIVAVVVAIYSFFPSAAYTLGTVLLIPGSIILLLLAIRSGFLVFSHIVSDYEKPLTYISGITGFLIPAILILVLPITHGGFVDNVNGVEQLMLGSVLTSPHALSFVLFAVSSTLFLSSLLLADFSKVAKDKHAYEIYRRDALILGPVSLLSALLIMITMRYEAFWLFNGMMDYLFWLVVSAAMFVVTGIALIIPGKNGWTGLPRLGVVSAFIQYALASYAYGRAHLPYIIYPNVTIQNGFTDPASFRALFISYIVGFIILFPGFVYFWRLFMKDERYIKNEH
ncbi:cytochrome d ubiquinol oxidase subunit II [Sutcliffiella rhizosphaerae]|uniref:Cytochrome bd menaquinol oxidase subunit II n=1 Tax=Sutcliffiella rhizosphaerae TaxID=2880967 RepID=A0ABN8AE81_9BACI|nr:cytochrome d ubiquinol oxidase subunit II [Sutcliffiella rhizosphaerae]CAG9622412.1 Putative cytochrome bd menaquinol oxidase subunit II [Sutcliffiella rhizosphaerae]